jgi:truncated hemoglobin YjbI
VAPVPSVYEWAGGSEAFERLTEIFYRRHVLGDEVLGPVFALAADDAGLPSDPEFRSAFMAYIEWGTRIALHNSQPDADPPGEAPMPHWGWGEAPPYQA